MKSRDSDITLKVIILQWFGNWCDGPHNLNRSNKNKSIGGQVEENTKMIVIVWKTKCWPWWINLKKTPSCSMVRVMHF